MDKADAVYDMGDKIEFALKWNSKRAFDSMQMRIGIFTASQMAVGIAFSEKFSVVQGENTQKFVLDISTLLPGRYCLELIMVEFDDREVQVKHDVVDRDIIIFEIQVTQSGKIINGFNSSWGYYMLPEVECN